MRTGGRFVSGKEECVLGSKHQTSPKTENGSTTDHLVKSLATLDTVFFFEYGATYL